MSSSFTKLHSSLIPTSAVPTPTAVIATLSSSSIIPSSTFSTPPLSSPSQSSNASSDQGGGDPASSGALYLYTFLATLVLLLSVSSAIVVRSLILRRRNGRLIAEAIANGTWFQNPTAPPPVGDKPAFFEAFVAGSKGENAEKNPVETEDVDWQDIMPFSATYVHTPSDKTEDGKSTTVTAPPNITTSTPRRIATFASALRRVAPRTPTALLPPPVSAGMSSPPSPFSPSPPNGAATPAAPTPSPPSPGSPIDASFSPSSSSSTLRVAVLIAMPTPPQAPVPSGSRTAYGEEEEDIPHVEFGVAEVDVVNEARERSS